MKKSKKGLFTTVIFMIVMTVFVVGYFWKITNKTTDNSEEEYFPTEATKLMEMDLEKSYPATAREVVKLYSRITIVLCNEKLDEESVEVLAKQLRTLYSEELLENNDFAAQLEKLKTEIAGYEAAGTTITGYQVEMADSAVEWTSDDRNYYSIKAVFSAKTEGKTNRIYEEFLLCNEDGLWKIVGWRETDGAMMDTY